MGAEEGGGGKEEKFGRVPPPPGPPPGERPAGRGEGGLRDAASRRLLTALPISAAAPKTCSGNVFIDEFLIRQSSSVLSAAAAGKMPVEMCKTNRMRSAPSAAQIHAPFPVLRLPPLSAITSSPSSPPWRRRSRASGGGETEGSGAPPRSGFLRDQRVSQRNFLARSQAGAEPVGLRGGGWGGGWGVVCLFFYCLAKSLFIVRKTRSVRSLLLLPAARARRQRAKRSGAPIHTDTGWEMSVTPPPPNSHRSHSVTPQSTALLSPFVLRTSKLLLILNANTLLLLVVVVFISHFVVVVCLFVWLLLICNGEKKIEKKKKRKKKGKKKITTTKKAKTKKNPGECVRGGGGSKAVHWMGAINVHCSPPSPNSWERTRPAPLPAPCTEIQHTLGSRHPQTASTDRQTHRAAVPAAALLLLRCPRHPDNYK
ncbi:uncharacterized protein [Excalfactoria chinensis]|uniref:uncharacterized protein n=1 Tax=Excalfactoria chinensis TaxID=46218 RepID=UPI003B3AF0B3